MADNFDSFFNLDEVKTIDINSINVPEKNNDSIKFRQTFAEQSLQNSISIDLSKVSKKSLKEKSDNDIIINFPSTELVELQPNKNKKFALETFWDSKSVDNMLASIRDGKKVEYEQKLYDEALKKLNDIFFKVRYQCKSEKDVVAIEQLRTAILGNNMIPRLCAFGVKYKFEELLSTIENAQKTNKTFAPILERVEKDACMGLCMGFAPMYMELSNSVRYTYVSASNYLKRLENIRNLRPMLIEISKKFSSAFDEASEKKVIEFMLNTNFAPAFGVNAFIAFNHLYDNIEKYNDPSKFNGDKVALSSITNCFKIIDVAMGVNYFKKKELFELKSQELKRDEMMDKTDITSGKGEKEWLN